MTRYMDGVDRNPLQPDHDKEGYADLTPLIRSSNTIPIYAAAESRMLIRI